MKEDEQKTESNNQTKDVDSVGVEQLVMSDLVGKYVAVYPRNYGGYSIGRMEFLYVVKETPKQVKARESKDSHYERTINKTEILGIVSAGSLAKKRNQAKDVQNEYNKKRKELYDLYMEATIAVA